MFLARGIIVMLSHDVHLQGSPFSQALALSAYLYSHCLSNFWLCTYVVALQSQFINW